MDRLPRFKRAAAVAPIILTERDRHIIRLVHRHRFLRSSHVLSLIAGSPQHLLRRLQRLYHHGFLERPRAQLDYYHRPGSRRMVYGLGNKGGALLRKECGLALRPASWGEKNRAVGRVFLEHALLVSDVLVSLELACRRHGQVRLLREDEIPLQARRRPFQWKVKLGGLRLGVVPDRVFALEHRSRTGLLERAFCFLEADRGTMPVVRRRLSQTSFRRKLLAYQATWTQGLHRRLGIPRFRVITVTQAAARLQSLIKACTQLKRGHGLFLFADRQTVEKSGDPLAPIWQSGRGDETTGLLN